MKAVVQRVAQARVTVDGRVVGEIGRGLLALVGVGRADGSADARYIATKIATLRVFEGEGEMAPCRMNRSVADIGGAVLAVSQFTLYGDCRKGRRPSFVAAAPPAQAQALYAEVVEGIRATGLPVETGVFQAMMDVALVNDGPVTILLDSQQSP